MSLLHRLAISFVLLGQASCSVNRKYCEARAAAFVLVPAAVRQSSNGLGSYQFWMSDNNSPPQDETKNVFLEQLNIIYDSKCSVCRMEVEFLSKRMKEVQKNNNDKPALLLFTDLESDTYDPNHPRNGGVTYDMGMSRMHAVLPNGKTINGVSVFQEAYDIVGLPWVYGWTRVPFLNTMANAMYNVFARHRTAITRGEALDELIRKHYKPNNEGQALKVDDGDCVPCRNQVRT